MSGKFPSGKNHLRGTTITDQLEKTRQSDWRITSNMDLRRRKRTIFRGDNEVARSCQFATPAKTDTLDQGNSDLGDQEKFADHTVHGVEHLGNICARVIADIDACGERPLASPFDDNDGGFSLVRAGRQHYIKFAVQVEGA